MPQHSKLVISRDSWREKATARTAQIKELHKSRAKKNEQLAELRARVKTLEAEAASLKKKLASLPAAPVVDINQARETRLQCINLVTQTGVSFRSIPKILCLLVPAPWIPHFTSVINWVLRLGLGLLNQVKPITEPWLAVIDHSIDIGTKKVLVVLRLPVSALSQRGSAITLEDCECIGITVHETVNGKQVCDDLTDIFSKAGNPTGIIKDGDGSLNKGVNDWAEKHQSSVESIYDIGHCMAAALKKEYAETDDYKNFTALTTKASHRLRQTKLAFLMPPKLRSKGRFQSIGKLGKWAEKIFGVLQEQAQDKKIIEKLNKALPDFLSFEPFIRGFAQTGKIVSSVLEVLKNKGLNQESHTQCVALSNELPAESVTRIRLQTWLDTHLEVQKKIAPNTPLPVSSDIVESLLGRFKYAVARNPQADMNRMALLIPTLCGKLDGNTISRTLSATPHKDLQEWEENNISYTVRKMRRDFLMENKSQKQGVGNPA